MMECKDCGRKFKNALGLKIHMARCPARKELQADVPQPIEEFKGVPVADPFAMLKTEVEMEADRNGHDLGAWSEHVGWAEVRCRDCGAHGTAASSPAAGTPRADARQLVKPCK